MSLPPTHPESSNQGIFKSPLRSLTIMSLAYSVSDNLPVPTAHHDNHMKPPSLFTEKMGHVLRPSLVHKSTHRSGRRHTGTKPLGKRSHSPAIALHNPLHLFPVHHQRLLPFEHHRNASVSVPGIALNQFINRFLHLPIHRWQPTRPRLILNARPPNLQPSGNLSQAHRLALLAHQGPYSEDESSSSESSRIFLAFFETSICRTISPIFSRWALSSSSYTDSAFFALARRPCRPYSRNVSIHFWISLCLRSYSLAAFTMVFWHLMISNTRSALRRAVHLSIAGWLSPFLSTIYPLSSNYTSYKWYSRSGGHYIGTISDQVFEEMPVSFNMRAQKQGRFPWVLYLPDAGTSPSSACPL